MGSAGAQRFALDRLSGVRSQHLAVRIGQVHGNQHLQRLLANLAASAAVQRSQDSHRFGGDPELEKIASGALTLKQGSRGLTVTKMQQALIDLGYTLPKFGVDGVFWKETEKALIKYQGDVGVPPSGELDKATLAKLQAKFDTRQPYLDNATFDPKNPNKGTRNLSAADKAAVEKALAPARGGGGKASTFQDDVGGKKYGEEMNDRLTKIISALHKELFADKEPLRKDAKNLHDWSVLEGPAAAAKDVTDNVYGTYGKGPKMTHAAGNFVDQWDDEVARDAALSAPEKKKKATDKVWYLIVSNCTEVSDKHSAIPTDPKEKAILDPIVESFVDTAPKVQTMLDLDVGWEGAELEGVVYLQRFKEATADKNREQLWTLFHTCIHEYMHSLTHPDYQKYAEGFRSKGDEARYNTLIEGMDEFFTTTVRKTVAVTPALRTQVEGPYFDAKATAPTIDPAVYPSIAQAEQVVSIVGVRNAEAAYFKGDVKKIGGK